MTDDIFIRFFDMPTTIRGYTVANQDGSYTVVLNSRISWEQQKETYAHEVGHIKRGDFERQCSADLIEIFAHK